MGNLVPLAPASGQSFARLTESHYKVFPTIKAIIDRHAKAALATLYTHINHDPVASRMFSSPEHQQAAAKAQVRHWQQLFAGTFDGVAIKRSEAVGQIHAATGLSPSYYISAYIRLWRGEHNDNNREVSIM